MENELFVNAEALQSHPPVMTSQSSSPAMLNWVSTQPLDTTQSHNLSRDSLFWEKSTEQSIFDSNFIAKLGNINEIYGTPTTTLAEFPGDPGFAERAAKFSCFGNRSFNGITKSPLPTDNGQITTNENLPLVFNTPVPQIPAGEISRKRKTKSKQHSLSKEEDFDAKRNKKTEENEDKTKLDDPYKDYIHVRARRGQATDSHSLAERVRREKISERMKLLQDLVPGCNKVTGKALMLDEIINYVQSLQRQVEFLSMKLSSVNTRLDFNMDSYMSKDVFTSSNNLMQHQVLHQLDSSKKSLQLNPEISFNNIINHLETSESRSFIPHLPTISQYSTFSEDDLHSIIRMGFAQNQGSSSQVPSSHMKDEL